MCGIVGYLEKRGTEGDNIGSILLEMLNALACRGPDSTGVALFGERRPNQLVAQIKLGDDGNRAERAREIEIIAEKFGAREFTQTGAYLRNQAAAAVPGTQQPRIVANALDNSLLIQADGQQYQSILKMLEQIDILPRQILLEAKIYSVDLTSTFAAGITAALQRPNGADLGFLGSLASGGGISLQAGAMVSAAKELLATLTLSENSSKVHMLSEPSLIATDSIPANITVGTEVPVVTSTAPSAVLVGGTTVPTQTISAQNTGITLQVNARVNPSGIVTLIVDQENSSVSPTSTSTATPAFDQQVVQTQITLQDGDTIALGGLISENTSVTSSGIPFLNRLPWVGGLFGSKGVAKSRSELVIFMTPHVIHDNSDLLEASDELLRDMTKMRKYIKESQ